MYHRLNMFHTFLPSEMTKNESIAKLKKGTVVRNIESGLPATVSVAPDPNKTSGKFGIDNDDKRTQYPKSWTVDDSLGETKESKPKESKPKESKPTKTNKPTTSQTKTMKKVSNLSSKHQTELDALLKRQLLEMTTLNGQLQKQHENELAKLKKKHQQEIKELKQKHMRQETTQARSEMQVRHQQELEDMKKTHAQEITKLKRVHREELDTFDAQVVSSQKTLLV